jgi:hypothetical protein
MAKWLMSWRTAVFECGVKRLCRSRTQRSQRRPWKRSKAFLFTQNPWWVCHVWSLTLHGADGHFSESANIFCPDTIGCRREAVRQGALWRAQGKQVATQKSVHLLPPATFSLTALRGYSIYQSDQTEIPCEEISSGKCVSQNCKSCFKQTFFFLIVDGAASAPASRRPNVQMPDEYLPPNKILFLQNLPESVTKDQLMALFSQYVSSILLVIPRLMWRCFVFQISKLIRSSSHCNQKRHRFCRVYRRGECYRCKRSPPQL